MGKRYDQRLKNIIPDGWYCHREFIKLRDEAELLNNFERVITTLW